MDDKRRRKNVTTQSTLCYTTLTVKHVALYQISKSIRRTDFEDSGCFRISYAHIFCFSLFSLIISFDVER